MSRLPLFQRFVLADWTLVSTPGLTPVCMLVTHSGMNSTGTVRTAPSTTVLHTLSPTDPHVRVLSWHTPGSGDTTAADPAAAAEAAGAAKDVVDAIRQLLDCTPQGPDDSDVDKIVKQFLAVRSGAVIAVL